MFKRRSAPRISTRTRQHTGGVVIQHWAVPMHAFTVMAWDVGLITTFGLSLTVHARDGRKIFMGGSLQVSLLSPCCSSEISSVKKKKPIPPKCSACGQKVDSEIATINDYWSDDRIDPLPFFANFYARAPQLERLVCRTAGVDALRAAMMVQESLALVTAALDEPWGTRPLDSQAIDPQVPIG